MIIVIFNCYISGEFRNEEIRDKAGRAHVFEFYRSQEPMKNVPERISSVRTENRDWCLGLRKLRRERIIELRELGKMAP